MTRIGVIDSFAACTSGYLVYPFDILQMSYKGVPMDFVSVRDFRTQPGEVWKKLAEHHELVVTRNGKPFAILAETSPTNLQTDLNALHRARFGEVLEAAWETSVQAGTARMSMDEIIAEIDKARHDDNAKTGT
jgi:hypothetical protein